MASARLLFGMAVVAAAIIAACEAYSESDATTPGDGGDAASEPDGGSGGDASSGDGSPDDGSSSDAAVPFCKANGRMFCETFDDPGSTGFSGEGVMSPGSTATLTDAGAFSAPNALRVMIPRPAADAGCTYATIGTPVLDKPIATGFRAEYRTRLVAGPSGGEPLSGLSMRLQSSTSGDGCWFYLTLSASGASYGFDFGFDQQSLPLTRKPLANQWSHVEIDLHGNPGTRALSVTIDGQPAGIDLAVPAACQSMDRFVRTELGFACVRNDVGNDLEALFDDVRVIVP